jgi:hypothetical protein
MLAHKVWIPNMHHDFACLFSLCLFFSFFLFSVLFRSSFSFVLDSTGWYRKNSRSPIVTWTSTMAFQEVAMRSYAFSSIEVFLRSLVTSETDESVFLSPFVPFGEVASASSASSLSMSFLAFSMF